MCIETGCIEEIYVISRGLCRKHYAMARNLGRLEKLPVKLCGFIGCDRQSVSLGLCDCHYRQKTRGQELAPIRIITPPPEGMKRCCRCKENLPHDNFGGITKINNYCRTCVNIVQREYEDAINTKFPDMTNREVHNSSNKSRAAIRYIINRGLLSEYFIGKGCIDCGEIDPIVFEFDHIDPKTKKFQISNVMGSYNWTTILVEISKCEIRCANCHRRRSVLQFGWRTVGEEPIRLGASDDCSRAEQRKSCDKYRLWLNRGFLNEFFEDKFCVDCGEADATVFEFDHVRGIKKRTISDIIGKCSWTTVLTEIEKCDIRCANCHRRKTVLGIRAKGGGANVR